MLVNSTLHFLCFKYVIFFLNLIESRKNKSLSDLEMIVIGAMTINIDEDIPAVDHLEIVISDEIVEAVVVTIKIKKKEKRSARKNENYA